MKYPFASLRFWIGFFLFSIYLLSFSGKFHVMDELAVFTAGNNLAQHGRADINQLLWTNHWTPNPPGVWGQDGHLYTKKAPGISFITAPLIGLGHWLPDLNAVHVGLLTNAFVTALTASFLFVWLTDLGFSRLTATLTSFGYGLCTIAWIYARMFWESSLLALSFLVAVWAVYRATRLAYARQRLFWILLGGSAIAIGLTLRFETLPAILFIGLYLVWESASWQISQLNGAGWTSVNKSHKVIHHPTFSWQKLVGILLAIPWPRLVIYLTPTVLLGLALLYFNLSRYGSLSETGYTQELRFIPPWIGGFGLLLSPGRGLFIYAPFTLLLFFGLRPARRRLSPPYFWLLAVLCLFYWLFYGAWFAWGGTWGWGPRFLLPILPLLMLFVAEPIEWTSQRTPPLTPHVTRQTKGVRWAWLGIGLLALLSLIVNFLGIAVDFNEHFLRLNRNDNFVFNWADFPPLAHWRILQEGLIDIIWVRQQANGLTIEWSILTPALILFVLALAGLGVTLKNEIYSLKNSPAHPRAKPKPSTPDALRTTLYVLLFILLPVTLIYEMMLGTARLAMENEQAQADTPLLETLRDAAQPDDVLLMPMPPFGDVQEVSTWLIAYLDQRLPTAVWIESEPRALTPAERGHISDTTQTQAKRVWLFERWLTQTGPTTLTAAYFNQTAFPLQEIWFDKSGKLTLYALADEALSAQPTPLNIPFQGGLTLLDFTLLDPVLTPDQSVIRLRLTWQASSAPELVAQGPAPGPLIVFAQLLDGDHPLAQNDRSLVDLQNLEQSPLRPGETVQQGYGLPLTPPVSRGSYPLVVGLYLAATGQRLTRSDGSLDDFLYLTNVVVQ